MSSSPRSVSVSLPIERAVISDLYGLTRTVTSLTISQAWQMLVPRYSPRSIGSLFLDDILWHNVYPDLIARISEKRARNRIANYLDPAEVVRVSDRIRAGHDEVSIRFGVSKSGHGYGKERGDFCLTSGVIDNRKLFLFYRSLEMIGGFAYDLCLMRELGIQLGIEWRSISIFARHAFVFALKGNSNEKLYPKLRRIFEN